MDTSTGREGLLGLWSLPETARCEPAGWISFLDPAKVRCTVKRDILPVRSCVVIFLRVPLISRGDEIVRRYAELGRCWTRPSFSH